MKHHKKPSWAERAAASTVLATALATGGCTDSDEALTKQNNQEQLADAESSNTPKAARDAAPARPDNRPGFETAKRIPDNLYNTLNHYEFTDQQGKTADLESIHDKLNANTALSFGFSACKGICPRNNANLAEIGNEHPDLQYIVISTWDKDGQNQSARDNYLETLEKQGLDPKRVTILYPEDRGDNGQRQLQKDVGERLVGKAPSHSSLITLHSPEGKKIGQHRGNVKDASDALSSMLDKAKQSQSR